MDPNKDISLLSFLWIKIKGYWKVVLGIVAGIVGLVLLKKSNEGKILNNARDSHKKELEVIEKSSTIEKELKADARKKFEKAIEKIENDFDVKASEITEEKRRAIKELVTRSDIDPDTITEELANLLSIDFVKRK